MPWFRHIVATGVVSLSFGCSGDEGSGESFVEILPACQRPCVKLRLWAEGEWRGPPPPYSSQGLGAIACHTGSGRPSPYATRFSYDHTTGIAEFDCDGEGGLHLSGRLTQVFTDSTAAARGLFGPGSSLVLSATGDAAQLLASVIDPAGTDLWPLFSEPPYWVRNQFGVYSPSPLQGDLPSDYDASLGAAPSAWFEAEIKLPEQAAEAESNPTSP